MQHSHSLVRSVLTQLAIFIVLTLSITGAWATYTSITAGSIATGQPVNAALMQQIKDNLDDLNARVAKQAISGTVITASIPAPQTRTNTCTGPTATLTITTAWYYSVYLEARWYKYTGTYNNLAIIFSDPSDVLVLADTVSFPSGVANAGYMYPTISSVIHLSVGTHTVSVTWSDANNCATSSMNQIFSWTATVRLLQAD